MTSPVRSSLVAGSLNLGALAAIDDLERNADRCGTAVQKLGAGGERIDCGVAVPGGLAAGVALATVCLADLADVSLVPSPLAEVASLDVVVRTDHPVAACLAAQYAGWRIKVGDFFGMGSGPMRAAAGLEPVFDEIGFRESPRAVVGVLESTALPGDEVFAYVAEKCRVPQERVTLLVAPTASTAGTLQVVARSVETALHKLHELNFDVARIVSGFGAAPLPPPHPDFVRGMGRTNDAILYGGRVTLFVRGDDDSLAEVVRKTPSDASSDYGRPFAEVFQAAGRDFYKIDPLLFSPAVVTFHNLDTGRTHRAGRVRTDVLERSFG